MTEIRMKKAQYPMMITTTIAPAAPDLPLAPMVTVQSTQGLQIVETTSPSLTTHILKLATDTATTLKVQGQKKKGKGRKSRVILATVQITLPQEAPVVPVMVTIQAGKKAEPVVATMKTPGLRLSLTTETTLTIRIPDTVPALPVKVTVQTPGTVSSVAFPQKPAPETASGKEAAAVVPA